MRRLNLTFINRNPNHLLYNDIDFHYQNYNPIFWDNADLVASPDDIGTEV